MGGGMSLLNGVWGAPDPREVGHDATAGTTQGGASCRDVGCWDADGTQARDRDRPTGGDEAPAGL